MNAKTINLLIYGLLFALVGTVIVVVLDDATNDLGSLGTSFNNLLSGIAKGLGWLNPGNWTIFNKSGS